MAHFDSYRWDIQNGVCLVHHLPELPCPACMANPQAQPDMYLVLDDIEKSGYLGREDFIIPEGFDPAIHAVH